ncbi:YoaK family protein [Streptococcus cameli]
MSSKKHYRIFEGFRIAAVLTFISGFLNAFTFVTQGGRFAGIQSGNVLLLAHYLALGNGEQMFNFTIPIVSFVCGQFFTYRIRKWFEHSPYPWHFSSSLMMTILLLAAIILTPIFANNLTIAILAFVSSIQIETFRRIRGNAYANVMMTGNVKNAAYLWYMGVVEKDPILKEKGQHIFIIILSFMVGVFIATRLSLVFGEYALIFVLIPMMIVNLQLWYEKKLGIA